MPCSGVTYNLTNTGCNDASKLNANFTDLCTAINNTETTINEAITGIYEDITIINNVIASLTGSVTGIQGETGPAGTGGETGSLSVAFNGGLGYVKQGYKSYIELPYNMKFLDYSLYTGETGSLYIDLRKTDHSSFPPDSYNDSIIGYTGIYTDLEIKTTGSVTGWSAPTGAHDDILSIYVSGVTGINTATFNLKYARI